MLFQACCYIGHNIKQCSKSRWPDASFKTQSVFYFKQARCAYNFSALMGSSLTVNQFLTCLHYYLILYHPKYVRNVRTERKSHLQNKTQSKEIRADVGFKFMNRENKLQGALSSNFRIEFCPILFILRLLCIFPSIICTSPCSLLK